MRLSNVLMALPLVKEKKQLWPLDAVLMCHLPTATFTNMFMGFLISLCFSSLPRRVCALSSCLCSFACLPIFLAFPSLVPACPYVSSSCALRVLYLSPTCPLFAPCSPCSACTLLTLCPACPLLSPHVPYLSPICPLLASLFFCSEPPLQHLLYTMLFAAHCASHLDPILYAHTCSFLVSAQLLCANCRTHLPVCFSKHFQRHHAFCWFCLCCSSSFFFSCIASLSFKHSALYL